MRRPLVSCLLVACVAWCPAAAEDDAGPYWKRNLFRRVLEDQPFAVTTWWGSEARRWQFSAPLLIGGVAAATSGGVETGPDLRFQRAVEAGTTDREAAVARGFTRLGDASTGAVLLGGSYLVARWTGNERLAEATSLSAEALLNSGLWNELLKRTLSRTRPAGGNRGDFFQYQPPPGGQGGSFPSGHAMGAFAVATVFAREYADHRWMPWMAYGTATLISASRVSLGRHFPSDVVVGGLLGNSLARMVLARRDGTMPDDAQGRLGLMADPSARTVGATYQRRW